MNILAIVTITRGVHQSIGVRQFNQVKIMYILTIDLTSLTFNSWGTAFFAGPFRPGVTALLNIAVIATTAICMYTDIRTGKIRNKLIYPVAALGIICNLFSTQPGIFQSVAGLVGALCFYGFLWQSGALGAGDVKLFAALGALKGISFLVFASVYILGFACLFAIIVLAIHGRLLPVLKWSGQSLLAMVFPFVPRPYQLKGSVSMPVAPAIFLGTVCALCLEAVSGPFPFLS